MIDSNYMYFIYDRKYIEMVIFDFRSKLTISVAYDTTSKMLARYICYYPS